ncbi:unnamed protein product [Arabis nemorensis]|uniref:DAGKc domain-containing protein n=1 Tax=Arabis nemorensis TaxID=586526 RepID=A0A565CJE7_9BRAS|nr:unnamed protein product [Arabis nemorensis]
MQSSGVNRDSSSNVSIPQLKRLGSQQKSPVVFPERRSKKVNSRVDEHRIDIGGGGDEKSDLLDDLLYSGKLVLDKRKSASSKDDADTDMSSKKAVDAKLTTVALFWGSSMLLLDDVVAVTYNVGLRYFTVHAYPIGKGSCGISCFMKSKRRHKDFRFVAPTVLEAVQWVAGFGDRQCFIHCLPHPLVSKKQASSELFSVPMDTPSEIAIRCKSPPRMLVILNPRSGHGRSSRVFHDIVEPIFKLAGIKLEVVKTNRAGHAKELASTVDISSCSDGIICVGGDGIINEVLNGLLSRSSLKEGISIPIGIIPAGSDNSLVWTVLGVRDPISAAISIVKGGLTTIDVFAVEWIQTGVFHFGMTVSYYGFVSDVLAASEKYQKRFGPLRYFVAGFLKFLCLPKYSYEVEYLPAHKEDPEAQNRGDEEVLDMQDLYTDVMKRSSREELPRASSLSSIDSAMTPSRVSGGELDTSQSTHASAEPSDYVRGIDPKAKRQSFGRRDVTTEPEVVHPQLPLSTTPNWPRTRSKSRTDRAWAGLTAVDDPSTRSSLGNAGTAHDREDISSTVSDPGPIWDSEPKWDSEPNPWDVENPIELPGPQEDIETRLRNQVRPRFEDKWMGKKGNFLGIMVCNHACRTVQSSQVVAPNAEHDDGTMDMLLVHGSGRLRLLRFFLLLQMGRHLSLPYVECIKVRSVKIKAMRQTHNSCGIDGELFGLNGQVVSNGDGDITTVAVRIPNHHRETKEAEDSSNCADLILQHILSFIPTRFAIRTSVLSKRWKHICKSNPNSLHGSQDDEFPSLYHHMIEHMPYVDGWIEFVISRNAEIMSLNLLVDNYNIPDFFYTNFSLKQLTVSLYFNEWNIPMSCLVSWTSLKMLTLRCCPFSNECIDKIISGCPVLESLKLYNCNKLMMKVLDLTKPLRLRSLEIDQCKWVDMGTVEIVAPQIHYLRLTNSKRPCILVDVSSLTEARLDPCFPLYEELQSDLVLKMLEKLHNVEKLTCGANFLKILSHDEFLAVFFSRA